MPGALSIDDISTRRLRLMEGWEASRLGNLDRARQSLAREMNISEGALERVRRGRVKGIKAWVADAIRDVFVALLQREIAGLEHDLAMALARGEAPDGAAACAAHDAIAQARQVIRDAPR